MTDKEAAQIYREVAKVNAYLKANNPARLALQEVGDE